MKYNIELRNGFETLVDIEDPEVEHDIILATYRDTPKKVLERSEKLSKPWIGSKTCGKIKERKVANLILKGARSERLKQRWREEHNLKNNEVKRKLRKIRELI